MGKEKTRLTFDGGLLDSSPNRIKKNNINNTLITKIFLIKKYWFGESPWLSTTAENIGKQKAKKPVHLPCGAFASVSQKLLQ